MVPQTIFSDDDFVFIDDFNVDPKMHIPSPSSARKTDSISTEQSGSPAEAIRDRILERSQTPESRTLPLRSHSIPSPLTDSHRSLQDVQVQEKVPEDKGEERPKEDASPSVQEPVELKSAPRSGSNDLNEKKSNVLPQNCGVCHCEVDNRSRDRSIPALSSYAPPPPPLPMPVHNFPPGPPPPGFTPAPFNQKSKKPKSGKRYLPPPPPPFSPSAPLAPPPPPPLPYGVFGSSQPDPNLIKSYTDLIPTEYTNDIKPEDRLVRTSFNKDIYTYYHTAGLYDFEKYSAVLRAADPETWYQYPSTSDSAYMTTLLEAGQLEDALDYLSPDINGRRICPLTFITPQIWACAALTAPLDDDVRNCSAGHQENTPIPRRPSFDNICGDCTMVAARKLRNTSLVYYSVLSTYHDSNAYSLPHHPGQNPMYKVFKISKFGNRESAAAEAFYAAGKEGWSTAFSCVMRADAQGAFARGARVVRVEKLSELGSEDVQESVGVKVRVFF